MVSDFIAESTSRRELSCFAAIIRMAFPGGSELKFPIMRLLERISKYVPGSDFKVEEDFYFKDGVHAETDVVNRLIRIRESVYDSACDGNGRDRMTITHEIGHLLLVCEFGFTLQRNFSKREVLPFEDPEWQAKCFAGELLAPSHLIGGMTAGQVATTFGVSYEAAQVQLRASQGRRTM